jgi:hypothetical protein
VPGRRRYREMLTPLPSASVVVQVYWSRDVVFGEDPQGACVGNGPQAMAILRNLAISLCRLAGIAQVKRLTESIAADRMRILPVLAAALHR